MKPIHVGIGLTAVVLAIGLFVLGPVMEALAPYRQVLWQAYGGELLAYGALAVASSVAVFYELARVLGLADLGRRLGLVERAIRRGEGDADLEHALGRDADGAYPE